MLVKKWKHGSFCILLYYICLEEGVKSLRDRSLFIARGRGGKILGGISRNWEPKRGDRRKLWKDSEEGHSNLLGKLRHGEGIAKVIKSCFDCPQVTASFPVIPANSGSDVICGIARTGLGTRLRSDLGHSRVPKTLTFKMIEARGTTFLVKMSFICMRMKNDFHIKGWAPTLVLKQRPGGTRKWLIAHYDIII